MTIEKHLPENYFRNDNHKLLLNIFFTSHWLLERVKKFLENEDITPQQYNIMRILKHSNTPISTLKIRALMLDKMSDTSRIVERLVKKELASRQISKHDKRLVDVALTEKGAKLIDELEKKSNELDMIIGNLTPSNISELNTLLDKIHEEASQ